MLANVQLRLPEEPRPEAVASADALGAVYTPTFLAEWVASELGRWLPIDASVWDIACGEGALLAAAAEVGLRRYRLVGVDVDEHSLKRAAEVVPTARLLCRDTLAAGPSGDPATRLLEQIGSQPDGVILNPPWGVDLGARREELHAAGYALARGQFDSYDLFVELSLALLRDGGAAAFILPDSLLNPEHLLLRRLLLECTTLHLVARLGEGFFPVYRGTMVVVLTKQRAEPGHRTRCLRLTPTARQSILQGELTIGTAASERSHTVPQAWFSRTPQLRFELDVRPAERSRLELIESKNPMIWREWLRSGRGVELSKRGLIVRCPACEHALPMPRRPRLVRCRGCDTQFVSDHAPPEAIVAPIGVTPPSVGEWQSLIAGEDVRRYEAVPSRLIRVDVDGVSYKDAALYSQPKLLVRKTGVGLHAAIDESGALTTQVVFHYLPLRPKRDRFLLDYLAGVLNSRVLLAYYLRTRGESEWRSHPYVTQRVLEELPVPSPNDGRQRGLQTHAIAAAVREHRRSPSLESDLAIERLVLGLYGLTSRDWRWVMKVLAEAQDLEGIKELRVDRSTQVEPQQL